MILVTGGTGLVGSHLLYKLIENNNSVRAIHRKNSNLKRVEKVFNYYSSEGSRLFQKIEWLIADINDIPSLETAFQGITHVYHAAALITFNPKKYQKLLKVNAEGTSNIVNQCITNTIQKLCYVSTIGTIGKSIDNTMATEESPWNDQHVNVYAKAKYEAEMEVWRASQEGLSVVMVNPGVILGPGFWKFGSGALFKTADKGHSFYPPGGSGFITVHDVVRMMMLLMNSNIENERFIAVAENLSFQDILTRLSKALDRKPPTKQIRFWQLEILRILGFIWSSISGSGRQVTRSSIHSLKYRDKYSNDKIKSALDFKFEVLDETIIFSGQKYVAENR